MERSEGFDGTFGLSDGSDRRPRLGNCQLRIAQIAPLIESVPPDRYGGTERVIHTLIEELVLRGHDVTLFATADSHTSATLVPMAQAGIRRRNAYDEIALHIAMLEAVCIQANRFDVIHSHLGALGLPFSRRFQTPTVHTLHGRLDFAEHNEMFKYYQDHHVVTISQSQRAFLRGPLLTKSDTVYNGIDLERYPFRAVPQTPSYLAFLGRNSPEKGPEHAIDIARRAGLTLKVAAKIDAADRAWADQHFLPLLQGSGHVHMGEMNDQEKVEFLGGALALLFPIHWPEPFGLVMAEALACGTPVVAMSGGAVEEILEHGQTGYICQSVDEMVEVISSIPWIDRAVCRHRAVDRFSGKAMTDGYVATYERIIAEAPRMI